MADIKNLIEQRAGVPAHLLTGETNEEIIASAKALLAYRRDAAPHGSTRERFAAWFNQSYNAEAVNAQSAAAFAALAEIERQQAGGYPEIRDGQPQNFTPGDGRPTREQFAEYMREAFTGGRALGDGGGLIK